MAKPYCVPTTVAWIYVSYGTTFEFARFSSPPPQQFWYATRQWQASRVASHVSLYVMDKCAYLAHDPGRYACMLTQSTCSVKAQRCTSFLPIVRYNHVFCSCGEDCFFTIISPHSQFCSTNYSRKYSVVCCVDLSRLWWRWQLRLIVKNYNKLVGMIDRTTDRSINHSIYSRIVSFSLMYF